MSDDKTILQAVHTAEKNQANNDRSAANTSKSVGGEVGGAVGGNVGKALSMFGGLIGEAGKHIKNSVQDNVHDVALSDGTPAKIAVGQSSSSPVALVVTQDQISVIIGAERNETIVTLAGGQLTVGNAEDKHKKTATVQDPEVAALLAKMGSVKNVDQKTFDTLADGAVEAMRLVPPSTPNNAKPAKGASK